MKLIILFLVSLSAFSQASPPPNLLATQMHEVTFASTINVVKRNRVRYTYPTDVRYILKNQKDIKPPLKLNDEPLTLMNHPRCFLKDLQSPNYGPIVEKEGVKDGGNTGFDILAPNGHVIEITCKAVINQGPMVYH